MMTLLTLGQNKSERIIHYSPKEKFAFKGNEGNTKLEERGSSSGEELAQKKWRQEEEEWESGQNYVAGFEMESSETDNKKIKKNLQELVVVGEQQQQQHYR